MSLRVVSSIKNDLGRRASGDRGDVVLVGEISASLDLGDISKSSAE